jgi:hypothetical protein
MNNPTVLRRSPLGVFPGQPAPRLYDRAVEVLRTRHYSRRGGDLMLEPVKCALEEYQAKYRRPGLPELELSGLYALFPEQGPPAAGLAWRWPDPWPNGWRKGVYLLFNGSGRLLYVGKASMNNFIGSRLSSHFHTDHSTKACKVAAPGWSEQPVYLATLAVPEEMSFEAPALEEYLIERLAPSDNVRGRAQEDGPT